MSDMANRRYRAPEVEQLFERLLEDPDAAADEPIRFEAIEDEVAQPEPLQD